jgi:Spy/CpxP family protein refolding chaperone
MKSILTGVIALATSAVLVTTHAAAQQEAGQEGGRRQGPGRMQRGFDRGFEGLPLRELELTEAQQQDIRSIFEQNREAGRGAGDKLREARRALYEATVAESVDESAIRAAASALANAEAEAAISRARIYAQVWKVLTPEQQEKAKALREQRRER